MLNTLTRLILAIPVLCFLLGGADAAASGLQVTFGSNGVQRLVYNGVVLEDVGFYPSDAFHIGHMKVTDLSGNLLGYNWGESNNGRSYNSSSNTWKYNFPWGSISVQFVQSGDTLNMNVTAVNNGGSGVIFDGATIYPLALHFPQLPAGFVDQAYEHFAFNTTGPSVTLADFGQGEVATVLADASKPLYTGFQPAGATNTFFPIISGTAIDGMASFFPILDRPVSPGQTDSFTVSLRFGSSGAPTASLAADAYANWAATFPAQLNWPDRRIIGTAYLASSPSGNKTQPGGYPNNPRRYFNDSNASDFDVRTSGGLAKFQTAVLSQAQKNAANLKLLNGQGVITWDIEGEQYPQDTTYVCAPDQIATIAPEMESIVSDASSPYRGMKLDDAYFKTIRDAGYRVGVCIRPQHFGINSDGSAAQTFLDNSQIGAEMLRKMRFAHDRWGATLFYVDSAVDVNGGNLDPSIFQALAAALPDSLIMPEESTTKYYAYTAPFQTFIFHNDLGTATDVYNYYPNAFSVNLINDVDPARLLQYTPQLVASVLRGDILMVHADYWQANNAAVLLIYQAAGIFVPVTTPVVTTPVVTTPVVTTPVVTTPVVTTPVVTTPVVTTPVDTTRPVTTPVVTPPVVTPPVVTTPAATTYPLTLTSPTSGQTISGTITASSLIPYPLDPAGTYLIVDGQAMPSTGTTTYPYVYPVNTSLLTNGTHTIQVWAHNINNEVLLSAPVSVVVANSATTAVTTTPVVTTPVVTTPVDTTPAGSTPATTYPIALTYPASGQALAGTVVVTSSIPYPLDSAGTYLMLDGNIVPNTRTNTYPYVYKLDTSLFSAGTHMLQLWAHDINNDALLSNPVTVTF